MVTYRTKPTRHNVNTLPKWARTYILTGGIEGKLGKINSLPQWARDKINSIRRSETKAETHAGAHKNKSPAVVIIKKNPAYNEYRVPGVSGTEASAYYTEDREDAIATAKAEHGKDAIIKFRSVSSW